MEPGAMVDPVPTKQALVNTGLMLEERQVAALDTIAESTNRSRSEVARILLDRALGRVAA